MAGQTSSQSKGGRRTSGDSSGERPLRKRDAEVLEAAAKVFADRGYSEASVQDVADELGILKGSLYHYIDTKEDLLFWLLEDVHDDVEKILEDVTAEEDLDPLERLSLYVRSQVLYNLDNLQRISIYYHDVDRLSAERLEVILDQRHHHERFVGGLIREAQAAGLADDSLDPRVLTNCLFGTVIWTYRWYRPNGRISREKIASLCSSFALNGVIGSSGGK